MTISNSCTFSQHTQCSYIYGSIKYVMNLKLQWSAMMRLKMFQENMTDGDTYCPSAANNFSPKSYSMEYSPSWQHNSSFAGMEILHILRNLKVWSHHGSEFDYCVQKDMSLIQLQCQMNPQEFFFQYQIQSVQQNWNLFNLYVYLHLILNDLLQTQSSFWRAPNYPVAEGTTCYGTL